MAAGEGATEVVHTAFLPLPEDAVHMFEHAVVFLGANHQVQAGKLLEQFILPALGHAAHHAVHHVGAVPLLLGEQPHLAQGFLLRLFTDGAGVEQDHVRLVLTVRHGVPLLDEHAGHLFGVPFVHLAAVGFDVKLGHGKVSFSFSG